MNFDVKLRASTHRCQVENLPHRGLQGLCLGARWSISQLNQLYLCGVYTEHAKLNQMLLEILLRFPELGAKMIHPKQDNHK